MMKTSSLLLCVVDDCFLVQGYCKHWLIYYVTFPVTLRDASRKQMTHSMFLNFAGSAFSQVLSVSVQSPYLESPLAIGSRKAHINCKPENSVQNTGGKIKCGCLGCLLMCSKSIYKKKKPKVALAGGSQPQLRP